MRDKKVVFLGGATGIGAAAIRLFAERGADVALGDIQDVPATELIAEVQSHGHRSLFRHTEATAEADVSTFIDAAAQTFDGIDVLVNVVGIATASRVEDMPADMWDTQLTVNTRPCFLSTKYAIKYLRASGRGVIVNISSIAALRGLAPGSAHYAASKGAVLSFSRAMAIELAPEIRVNCVCPGHTRTGFNDPFFDLRGGYDAFKEMIPEIIPLQREAEPDEIAQALLFLASDASSFITGAALVVDGGVLR